MVKKVKFILFWTVSILVGLVLMLAIYLMFVWIKEKLFLPEEYLMWIFEYPTSRLVIVYQIYLFIICLFLYKRWFKKEQEVAAVTSRPSLFNKYKKIVTYPFIVLNIVLLYTIIISTTVITNNKIVDYSFLSPFGTEYAYTDIVEIHTGVYGKKSERTFLPFTHPKGTFFYKLKLHDGTEIDFTEEVRGYGEEHELFIIEKFDSTLVNMGIPKITSLENFEYATKHLGKIYSDEIYAILENSN